jgi:hypothetical protein
MTVGELIEELTGRDPSMEVVASCAMPDGEYEDELVTGAYVSLGRLFLSCGEDA